MSIEAAAGVKLYITPQDRKTAGELSQAIGNETRLRRSVSRKQHEGLVGNSHISLSEEARPLLSEQDARRLDPDTIIVLAAGLHPIKATRIKYFADQRLAALYDAQSGPLPTLEGTNLAASEVSKVKLKETERKLEVTQRTADELGEKLDTAMSRIAFMEHAWMELELQNRKMLSLNESAEDGELGVSASEEPTKLSVESQNDANDLSERIKTLGITPDETIKHSKEIEGPVSRRSRKVLKI